jgi:hypothetical protein
VNWTCGPLTLKPNHKRIAAYHASLTDRPLQRPARENRFASVVMSERESFFDELKRRNVIPMAGLYLRFQALLKLPAAGEKDVAHE